MYVPPPHSQAAKASRLPTPMAASSNRFEALSEEEEIDFEDESKLDDDISMDSNSDVGDNTVDKASGPSSSVKKSVSFAVVKRRSRLSKAKRVSRTSASDGVTQDLGGRSSQLVRSGLASTFKSASPTLVSLSSPRRPSGRGGGLCLPAESQGSTIVSGNLEKSVVPLTVVDGQFQDRMEDTEFKSGGVSSKVIDSSSSEIKEGSVHTSSLQDALTHSRTAHSTEPSPTAPESSHKDPIQESPQTLTQKQASTDTALLTTSTPINNTVGSTSVNLPSEALAPSEFPPTPTAATSKSAEQSLPCQLVINNPSSVPVSATISTSSQSQVTASKPKSTLRLNTFRAQLTFGLKPAQKVNVAELFTSWIEASINLLADFALLPYDDTKQESVTSVAQICRGDPEFFTTYYGNHRSLVHGNLTGMVHFQTSTTWSSIKAFKSRYFAWLTDHRVFINYTRFKTETLVPCGFLVGAHPGHFRRLEAEEELHASLGLDPGELPFQLSARSVSVPIKEHDTRRYSFNAVVVETSTKHATQLRERFYELQDPLVAIKDYPYTGLYQFVPMVKSTEWPIDKIFKLAHLHSSIIDDLKTIHVHHIQDLNNVIHDSGYSLLQGFYGMTVSGQPSNDINDRLLHSIHNTARQGVKVALVSTSKYESALGQFANLFNILSGSIDPKYHSCVFVSGNRPKMSGRHVDSVSSGNYSSFADALLENYNPQTGEEQVPEYIPPAVKRHRPAVLTYAQAAAPTPIPTLVAPAAPQTISAITQDDMEKLFTEFSKKFSTATNSTMSIAALEKQVQQTSSEIQEVKASFQTQLQTVIDQNASLSSNMVDLNDTIKRQNFVIACIQQEFKETMSDLYLKLGLAPSVKTGAPPVTTTAPHLAVQNLATQMGGNYE